MNMSKPIEVLIAEDVKENGGRVFYVGGYVRDKILGNITNDVDIEVHGIEAEKLVEILGKYDEVLKIGNSFGIYTLMSHHIDIALPRKEKNTGKGHKDFEIYTDPYIGTYEAAKRRDFTMNSIMEDVLTHEIIDHFNGLDDIRNKTIRHIDDETFVEDPLRVLRAAQFASRLGFLVDDKTIELCKRIDITTLSRERVEEELKKALLKSDKPSVFFRTLNEMNQLDYWFKEIKDTIGIIQDPFYHPEGDVFTHTMMVIDEECKYRELVDYDIGFMFMGICHDLGKTITTTVDEKGRVHTYNHETEGIPIIKTFLDRITRNSEIISYVTNMVPLHMKLNIMHRDQASIKATNAAFDKASHPLDLIYFALCDHPIKEDYDRKEFHFNRYELYKEIMAKPYVKGEDLLKAGIEPGVKYKEALEYAHKLRLADTPKDTALKQTLSYIRKHH